MHWKETNSWKLFIREIITRDVPWKGAFKKYVLHGGGGDPYKVHKNKRGGSQAYLYVHSMNVHALISSYKLFDIC